RLEEIDRDTRLDVDAGRGLRLPLGAATDHPQRPEPRGDVGHDRGGRAGVEPVADLETRAHLHARAGADLAADVPFVEARLGVQLEQVSADRWHFNAARAAAQCTPTRRCDARSGAGAGGSCTDPAWQTSLPFPRSATIWTASATRRTS